MDANVTHFQTRYPTRLTLDTLNRPSGFLLRGYHPLWLFFPEYLNCPSGRKESTHMLVGLLQQIRFALYRFRSPLLTAFQLVSFPAGTKMLQFPAFPILSDRLGDLRFKGCMRLPEAYRSLPRPSSALKPRHPPYRVAPNLRTSYSTTSLVENKFQPQVKQTFIVLSSLNLMRDSQLMTPVKLAMRVIVCGTINKNASAHSPRGYYFNCRSAPKKERHMN